MSKGNGDTKTQKQITPFIIDNFGSERDGNLYLLNSNSNSINSASSLYKNSRVMEISLSAEPSAVVGFVAPLFTFLRGTLLSHYSFDFDVKTQSFHCHPGSPLRKIVVMIVQFLVLVQTYAESKWLVEQMEGKPLLIMYKVMGAVYLFYYASFFYTILRKGEEFCHIFNFIQYMTDMIRKSGCIIPRKKLVKIISIGLLLIYLLHAIIYTLTTVDGRIGHSLLDGPTTFIQACADHGFRTIWSLWTSGNETGVQLKEYNFSEHFPAAAVFLVAILWILVSFMAALTWLSAFLMTCLWGLLFWKVLYIFFKVIGKTPIRNTLEDIRTFNTITRIIDRFNDSFSWHIFAGVLTGVAHFSVNIFDLFSNETEWILKFITGFSFLMFGLKLLAAAQVNQNAVNITELIKHRYQMEPVWKEFHGTSVETLQGMLLVFHEIQSNKIGFRGLGFFTITYAFIGTVLSVISTYSVIVMQLQK